MPSPMLTEILARSGFDFQILDCEHGNYDFATLLADILACEVNRSAPYIRVSGTSKVEVQRCLDLGARGIIFPQLADYEDFAGAAEMMDYAPGGTRGFNPFVRGGDYGFSKGTEAPSTPPLFIPIIETLEAVEQLDRILQIGRIDMVYLGTYDLTAQLGCPGEMENPKTVEVVDQILESCRRNSVPPSMMSLSPGITRSLRKRGVDVLVHGVETHRLREGLTAILADA